jgi:hypothetical protein
MTKSVKPNENELSELYQQRKQAHRAPRSIKQFLQANNTDANTWSYFFNRIGGVAAAAGILLLVGLVVVQKQNFDQPIYNESYSVIELHSLDIQKQSLNDNVRSRYAKHYNDFLKQKQVLAKHHSKAAVLKQFDDGWELTTCNQELVKISNELVSALREIDRVSNTLKTGDWVGVDFDRNGIIIAIIAQPEFPHC